MRTQHEAGFTLIELVITATLLAIAATAVASALIALTNLNRVSKNLAVATQAAQQKMELLRNGNYSALTNGTSSFSLPSALPTPNSATVTIADSSLNSYNDGTLKQVDIVISYTDKNITKNVRVSTLIGQTGVDR